MFVLKPYERGLFAFSQRIPFVLLTASNDIGTVGSKGGGDPVFKVAVEPLTAFRLVLHAMSRRIMPTEADVYRTVQETVPEISIGFIKKLAAQLDIIIPRASEVAKQDCAKVHFPYLRGQLMYFYLEAVLKSIAESNGIPVKPSYVRRLGGAYHIAKFPNIDLGCCVLQEQRLLPRKSKYQKMLASQNRWIEPPLFDAFDDALKPTKLISSTEMDCQRSLFEDVAASIERRLYMMIIAFHDQGRSNSLKFAGFGIPRPDLSGWIDRMSFEEVLALHGVAPTSPDTMPEVTDKATPMLKPQSDGKGDRA